MTVQPLRFNHGRVGQQSIPDPCYRALTQRAIVRWQQYEGLMSKVFLVPRDACHGANSQPTPVRQHSKSSILQQLAVTREQAAEITTLSVRNIDELITCGEISASKIGRRVLVDVRSIRAMLRRKAMNSSVEVQREN